MFNAFRSTPKEKYWDYFILTARVLLGLIFLSYGFSKLFNNQFGISEAEMSTPVQDISLFRLSWYVFDHQPFKALTGVGEIICGFLLLYNRTAIIGAFMYLPIVTTILIIDMTFMPHAHKVAFTFRLGAYIVLDLLILYHYRDRMHVIWNAVTNGVTTKFKYPIWAYLILPVLALFILEPMLAIPKALYLLAFHTQAALDAWAGLPQLLGEMWEKLF